MRIATMFMALGLVFSAACSSSSKQKPPPDAAVCPPPPTTCFNNPTTHDEIINACTDAQKIIKNDNPPLLNGDCSLPPLP